MKKTILLTIIMIVGFAMSIMAQTTANVNNTASCKIISPITITAGTHLQFGDIIAGDGDVVIAVGGGRTIPGALLSGTQLGTITAATFNIGGQGGYTYAITLPADEVVTISDGEETPATMAVKSFNCISAETSATGTSATGGTGTLAAGGTDVVTVGATLDVETGQAAGEYSGLFNVIVAYN